MNEDVLGLFAGQASHQASRAGLVGVTDKYAKPLAKLDMFVEAHLPAAGSACQTNCPAA
ncbi:hypothetical protein [Streptomyces griseorubiginosus]|uniref:hypothetical protein n=1 Tax=Streptomyces griseorubiginosus TaxID=67304 RepID=UPI0036E90167